MSPARPLAIWSIALVALVACEPGVTDPTSEIAPSFARAEAGAVPDASFDQARLDLLSAEIGEINARFEAAGEELRLQHPYMFVVGRGVDPFMNLRTGSRWPIAAPSYILDASDFTGDLPAPMTEAALAISYDVWNGIPQTYIETARVPDPGTNMDVLDGTFVLGACASIFDVTSPNLDLVAGEITPEADIVVGGWLPEEYFVECLGSEDIIGVTWTFSGGDVDRDQYPDILYVEQFYNEAFQWVVEGSTFLDGTTGVDLQTIATHENGHALGLDHFGGPLERQPFTLKPNGRVYNPEAVMNPFYLYGEKREPQSTDEAALKTLYSRSR